MRGHPSRGETPPSSSEESRSGSSQISARVLVLEADSTLRLELCRFLERAGCEPLPCTSIDEAANQLLRRPADVIVAEVLLQGPFGLGVLSLTERHCPTCPVIYLTDRPQLEDAARAMRQGAFDYLVKPVELGQLLRKIDAALRHKHLLDRQNRLEAENATYREHLEDLVHQRTRALEEANRRLTVEVTERERAEQALLNQSMFLETLMSSVPTPLFYKDTEGMYLGCNPAFTEFLGLDRQRILGRTVHECWPRHYARIYQERDDELLASGGLQEYEGPVRLPDGEERHVLFKKAVFPRADGAPGGIIGLIVDTTRRKRLEDALREASRQAQAANRAKSEFLASMSHEIRTPMTAILGMADLLWGSQLNGDQRKYVTIIRSAGENLLELINDILDLSRVESGRLQIEDIPFSLQGLAEQACDVVAHRAREKGLELSWRVCSSLPPHVMGDPARCNQVLVNLLGNAVKFTEKGEVALRIQRLDRPPMQLVHMQVSDTGIGIAPEDQEAIFHRFTQADTSTTRRFGGTGLGLSICKSLVEQMQGHIWVESTPGEGSTFHVSLPLRPASCALAPGSLGEKRALVAAASANLRLALKSQLLELGCACSECASLQELEQALEVCERPAALTLFVDEKLAHDGEGTLQPSLADSLADLATQGATLLLLTAGSMQPTRQDQGAGRGSLWSGALQKPVRRNELREALAAACGMLLAPEEAPGFDLDLHQDMAPLRILLVEDAASTQILVKEYFRHTPHSLVFAMNGLEGVRHFQNGSFDLVLMDLDMPVMDGFQALHEIRRHERETGRPSTQVIACSAKALKEDEQACLRAGFDAYMSKPMRRSDLLGAVRRAAESMHGNANARSREPVFLVADDSSVMRIIVSKVLKEMGHSRILEANNGREALELFLGGEVDCIICDRNMPRMKGIELLQQVRALPKGAATPFIMLTAEHQDEYVSRATAEGITRYVTKPFRLEQLKEIVGSVLLQRDA